MALNLPRAAAPDGPADVADLLLECHARIRRFSQMAVLLGTAEDLPAGEVREAAQRIRRYFVEALPLHVEDEDAHVAPRLRGADPEVDAALAQMTAEHHAHKPLLARLTGLCAELADDPGRLAALRADLARTASVLTAQFQTHLEQEERLMLPALRRLVPPDERAAMARALQARRQRSPQG